LVAPVPTSDKKLTTSKNNSYAYADDEDVHKPVDVSPLEHRLATVHHHQLRVLAGEDDETKAPAGVTKHTATQEQFVVV